MTAAEISIHAIGPDAEGFTVLIAELPPANCNAAAFGGVAQ